MTKFLSTLLFFCLLALAQAGSVTWATGEEKHNAGNKGKKVYLLTKLPRSGYKTFGQFVKSYVVDTGEVEKFSGNAKVAARQATDARITNSAKFYLGMFDKDNKTFYYVDVTTDMQSAVTSGKTYTAPTPTQIVSSSTSITMADVARPDGTLVTIF